jgi:NAD(P)-dependent dehydrogenase (short-subunit alcohol dehydrogenase family)
MDLNGKVFAVTGGGNGIGRAVVLELLRRGAKAAAIDLREESLEETVGLAQEPDRLATFTVDVTDRPAVEALPAQIANQLGAVDGLIHCAGIIQPFVVLNELDYDAIERVVNVNLWGTIYVTKAFLPTLLERPEAHIALVSSMGGFLPVPGQTIYGATKAGVKLMSEGLYAELLETNVGVSAVMPGAVGTNITAHSGVEIPVADPEAAAAGRKVTSPEEAANIILNGIEKGDLHIYVGRDSRMMNIFSRVAPRRSTHLIYKQMKDLLGN